MACSEWSEELSDLLDGRLDKTTENAVRTHLQDCEECRATLQSWQRLQSVLRAAPVPDAPAGMWRRVLRRSRRPALAPRYAPWPRLWWAAAAVAAIALTLMSLPQNNTPKPVQDDPVKVLTGYYADATAAALGGSPAMHLLATEELADARQHSQ